VTRLLLLVALCSLAVWQVTLPPAAAGASEGANLEDPQTIAFGSRTVQLTVNESPGDQEWARRVTEAVVAAGPALEEMIGVPYPGPEAMGISARSNEQLSGYAGLAGCSHVVCHIRLSENFRDTTLLHELTHAWTQSFRNRWLAEGMAEYISDRAAARIDGQPLPVPEPVGDRPPYPLLDWTLAIDLNTAEEEQITSEYEGYYWSQRFFEQLEATVGSEAVRRTMAAVVPLQAGTVGGRRFIDAVDEAGVQADDLFIRYVFPPDREQEIRDRRVARDRLAALTARTAAEAPELSQNVFAPVREQVAAWEFAGALATLDRLDAGLNAYLQLRERLSTLNSRATEAGLAYPYPLQNAVATWDFAPFLETIDAANGAIDAYLAAEQKLAAARGIWQRIRLFGRSPDAELDRAAQAFASADFTGTTDHSQAAEAQLQRAVSRALMNLLVGAGVLALILAAAALLLRWALTQEPAPTTRLVASPHTRRFRHRRLAGFLSLHQRQPQD
jgi:hypothetical protein